MKTEPTIDQIKEEGNILFNRGFYREAKEKFEYGLRVQPENKFLLSNLAGCLIQLGFFENANEIADRVIALDLMWSKGYHRKAMALFGLERYSEAKEMMLMALQIEPESDRLKGDLARIVEWLEEPKKGEVREVDMNKDDFECVLCLKLMYEPVTTPCGHTFCKKCLLRSLDHSISCPLCRAVVLSSKDHPVSVTLHNIIRSYFPEEYTRREREEKLESSIFSEQLPLFILNELVFPGQEFPMHIFEPRYRLMIRRCMDSDKKFGLVSTLPQQKEDKLREVGVCLEITALKVLPDGRMFISTTASFRFRILNFHEVDNYKMAKIEIIEDEPFEITEEMTETTQTLKDIITTLTPTLNIKPSMMNHYHNQLATLEDTNITAYIWLLLLTFPFPNDAKHYLLQSTSLQHRIEIIREILLSPL